MTRARGRAALLISFSGIDGAGKSTQIHNLRAYFEQAGLRVRLLSFWDEIACFKQLRESAGRKIYKGDAGVGSPETPIERRDKNVRSPLATVFRLGFYLADALSQRRAVRKALRSDADVVIFDRFLWDELANLDLRRTFFRQYARLSAILVPKPAISFVLDADPEQARLRKPEYPLEWLKINRSAYLQLAGLLGCITVIPALSAAEVQTVVRKRAAANLVDRTGLTGGGI